MDEVLRCSWCKERFGDVVKLIAECNNNVCELCYEYLKNLVDEETGRFVCPMCHDEHILPPDGLKENKLLQTIVKNFPKKTMPPSARELENQLKYLEDKFEKLLAFNGAELVEFKCDQLQVEVRDAIESAKNHLDKIETKLLDEIDEYRSRCLENIAAQSEERYRVLEELKSEIESFSTRWNDYFKRFEVYESESEIEAARVQAAGFFSAIELTEKSLSEAAYGWKEVAFQLNSQFWQTLDNVATIEQKLIPATETPTLLSTPNLLLIGESDVDKSTLVNLFANLLAYDSFEAAEQGELKCPAPTRFTLIDVNLNHIDIQVGQLANENQELKEPKTYCFNAKIGSEVRRLNVVDTPAVGGSGDLSKDKENFERIIEHIRKLEHGPIALCIVLDLNKLKSTNEFREHLRRLLVDLGFPTSNVCFCVTNSRGAAIQPDEADRLIRAELLEIKRETGAKFSSDAHSLFFFDCEPLKMLAAEKKGVDLEPLSINGFNQSWIENAVALNKMVAKIVSFNTEKLALNRKQIIPINILLLGDTGVGKSTLINFFANLLAYDSFEEAQQGQVKCLIPCIFKITDQKYNVIQINIGASESLPIGVSVTQEAATYSLNTQVDGKAVRLNLIDTPPIGDTRGVEQDKKNLDQVMEYIKRYDGLNAICILLNPNDSRLTLHTRYCLKELLVRLDRSAAPNICFCYTNSFYASFHPGESYPLIRSDIARESEVPVPLDSSNTFCFDSQAFRYLAAKEKDVSFDNSYVADFKISWEKSAEALKKMIIHAANLPPTFVKSIYDLNQARKSIAGIARFLTKFSHIKTQHQLDEQKIKELQDINTCIDSLNDRLYIDKFDIEIKPLEIIRTVCAHTLCRQVTFFHGQKNINSSECYRTCIDGVEAPTVDQLPIKKSPAFKNGTSDECIKCGHHWNLHMYVKENLKEAKVRVEDLDVKVMLEREEKRKQLLTACIPSTQDDVNDLQVKHASLLMSLAKIAKYIKHKSILYYNSDLDEYLALLIKEEEQKDKTGTKNQDVLNGLIKVKRENEATVKILIDNLNAGVDIKVATDEEIQQLFRKLRGTKISGIDLEQYIS